MKNVIIGVGIGIFITLVLLVSSLISSWEFTVLSIMVTVSGVFIFYEPRILKAKASKDGLELEMYEANAIKQGQVEPIPLKEDKESSGAFRAKMEAYGTDPDADLVIKSIGSTKYTFRNLEGIVADSNLTEDIVKDKLNWLIFHHFADEFEISGEKVYALSLKGHSVFSRITNPA